MLKKISIIIFILIVVIYFYQKNKTNQDANTYKELPSSNTTTIFKSPATTTTTINNQKIIKLKDKNFEDYEQIEKDWLTQIETVLGKRDFEFYLDLRSRNEEEKMVAYKEFHDYLRQKHGDNFSYNISEDQSIREKDINTKNTKELLKRIGNQKFTEYIKARDQFNEDLLRKSQDGTALTIEF